MGAEGGFKATFWRLCDRCINLRWCFSPGAWTPGRGWCSPGAWTPEKLTALVASGLVDRFQRFKDATIGAILKKAARPTRAVDKPRRR